MTGNFPASSAGWRLAASPEPEAAYEFYPSFGGGMKNQTLIYTPPVELDRMEQGLLGALLSGEDIPGTFDSQMFYDKKHSTIYKATRDLQALGISPDILSVTRRLSEIGQIDAVGGAAYVASLTNSVSLQSVIPHYAECITGEYERRMVKTALAKALEEMDRSYDTARIVQSVIEALSTHKTDTGRKTEWTAAELKAHEFPEITKLFININSYILQ
jgi:replicative DNA helicase